MSKPDYHSIIKHYENCLDKYGVSCKGMDWPNENDLRKRFDVMLAVVENGAKQPLSILDLGCGAGFFLDYLKTSVNHKDFNYSGIDISNKMISAATARHPESAFEKRDILEDPLPLESIDYIIMNGVLTEKVSLSYDEMEIYAKLLIKAAYGTSRLGIAFNVMSSHVDWSRDDLFHWPVDTAIDSEGNVYVVDAGNHRIQKFAPNPNYKSDN